MRPLSIPSSAIAARSPSLKRYLSEVSKIPLITVAEEIALAQRIRKGDTTAVDLLVRANLRFVISIAKQYQNNYLPLMDLISEGNIGLVEAARRFDDTKGFKFISYAVWWIRRAILAAISEQGRMIRLPAERIKLVRELRQCLTALEQQLEREPTLEEVAAAMEMPVSIMQEAWMLRTRHGSIYAALDVENAGCYLEVLENREALMPDEQLLAAEYLSPEMDRLLAHLSEREEGILRMWFGALPRPSPWEREKRFAIERGGFPNEPMSYDEIGKILGLSAHRVRVLKNRALLKLRMSLQ